MPRGSYDVVVVGGGPAGLSAALWLGRYRRSTLVVDAGAPRNASASQVHGYLGFPQGSPDDFLHEARSQLAEYRTVSLVHDRVAGIRRCGASLSVELETSGVVECRRIVLANGVRDRLPHTRGFDEHYGNTIFTCPSCDGFESLGKRTGVIGRTDEIADFAVSLLDWAGSVVIVTDGPRFEGDESRRKALDRLGIELREVGVAEFLGTDELRGLVLDDGSIVDCEMAFVALGHEPHNELALGLGCAIDPDDCVQVDDDGQTSVPGVYAAGDLTPGPHLVQIAAAEGAVAGVACAKAFHGERTEPRSPDPAPELPS